MSEYKTKAREDYTPNHKGILPGLIIIIAGMIFFGSSIIGLDKKTAGTFAGYEVGYIHEGHGKTRNRYLTDYMYEVNNETYTRTSHVKKTSLPDDYTVFYNSKNPNRSRELGELLDTGIKSAGFIAVGGVFLFCGIPLSKDKYEEYLHERITTDEY